jgi:hypothetical protein
MFSNIKEQTIVLLRHAKAVKNIQKRHGGKGSELVKDATNEIQTVCSKLLQLSIDFDCVLHSPQRQCEQTAKDIGERLSISVSKLTELEPINLGCVDGLSEDEVANLYPEIGTQLSKWRNDEIEITNSSTLTGGAWSPGNTVFTVAYGSLAYGTAYTVNISGFKDAAGNAMAADNTHSFTTVASVPAYGVSIATFTGGSVSANKAAYQAGETVTLTVAPATGYELSAISAYRTGAAGTTVALSGSGNTRTFTMPAYGVTVTATFGQTQAQQDAEAVAAAKAAIESVSGWTAAQATASSEAAVKTWIAQRIYALAGFSATGVTITAINITPGSFSAAVAGTASAPAGTNGSFTFTVALSKGSSSLTTASKAGTVTATPYTPPATYAVTIAATTNGTVSANPASTTAGATVTVTIAPASGYELNAVSAYRTGSQATTVALSGSGNTRTFTMPAYGVTVSATFGKTQAQQDREAADAAKAAIEGGTYRVAQATANETASVRTWLVNTLNTLFGQSHDMQLRSATSIDGDVTVTAITPATAGTESNPSGVNGAFTFTVTLNRGAGNATATVSSGVIIATPYSATPLKRIELLFMNNLTVRILNTGNTATGDLTLSLSGANADVFTLPATTVNSLAVGGETEITLSPRANLAQGVYTAMLTVSADGIAPVQTEITYTVTTTTGIDDIPQAKPLKAYMRNGRLHVEGLTAGKSWSVYSVSGTPVYQGKATGEEADVSLTVRGVYIVVSEGRSVKAVY